MKTSLTKERKLILARVSRCQKNYNTIALLRRAIISVIASPITSLTIVNSTVNSGADQRKHQSSASLAFVWGIHRWPVISPHKWPVTRNLFPFDDVKWTVAWFMTSVIRNCEIPIPIISQSYVQWEAYVNFRLGLMWLDVAVVYIVQRNPIPLKYSTFTLQHRIGW